LVWQFEFNKDQDVLTQSAAKKGDDSMRLKVTVVTPIFPVPVQPYRGHSEYQILLALSKHADVNVLCPFPRYPNWFKPRFDYRRPDLSYCPPDVATRYFEYPALPGVTRGINGWVCAKYLEAYFREYTPDVAYNFWLYPEGYATVAAARRVGIPSIVCSIGSDLNRIADPASKWLTRVTMNRATFVVTKGEYLRQQAIRMGIDPGKVINVLNGCDSNVFYLANRSAARAQLGIDDKAELVLFVGRLDTRKGILELLEAFASLANRRSNLRLAYIGDGPDGEQLRHRARDLAVEHRIVFANACPSRKVAQWLAAANLLALPSYSEGCPNVVIEALSCGRPVVATHVGGIPELVSAKSGILVPPRNSRVLADAIDIALERHWDERLISEQFRRGWDKAADETLSICELAVQQGTTKWRPPAEATTVTIR
jgi:teichuronic acid biosynthesis glycosyltransferase TuaC